MHNYYFVAPSLPVLVLGENPEISFAELMQRLELNLDREDLKKIEVIRRATDLHNIRSLYLEKPLDAHGNLSEKELDEALLVEADLPGYVFEFLGQFDETKEKARHFFGLLSRYYAEEIPKNEGFLRNLLEFQREVRLVLAALRAKKTGRDITEELQFEDFTDPFVAHILAQKDMDNYEPPIEYQDLKENLRSCGDDPWQQYQVIMECEFERIEDMSGYPLFALDWILGYIARLMLVEKWAALDPERGKEMIDKYKGIAS
ncbi:MAG: hypothetical protein K1000chlam2_01570 [Chlamydiae bacterium]|nr:hypothetical protein [Chlamydiota bacterium]